MENYKFAIPVRVNHIVDESTISIDNIDDLEEIEEKYGVDLDFIEDEFEYRITSEKDLDDDYDSQEYFGMSEEDIFSDVITDNWDDIIKKLNREYKLNDLSEEDVEKLFNITKENFDKNVTINNFENVLEDGVQMLSVSLDGFNKSKGEFYVLVSINEKIKKDDIEIIRSWVETQTSEEWGLKFSKIDLSDKLQSDDIYIYLIPWSLKKDVKYIKA
jgi:hypothetical protein